eukprot:6547892-Prymnesium_polylepis.1
MLGEQHVSRGLEKGVLCMHKGETAELLLRADYAYGDAGRPPLVPPGASVRYEVELISWRVPKKDRSELSDDEVLAEATRLKACGTRAFGDNSWQEAQHFYHDGAHLLLNDFEELRAPEGRELEARALLTSCWLNEAMCALRREEWFAAEKICTQARDQAAHAEGTRHSAAALCAKLEQGEHQRANTLASLTGRGPCSSRLCVPLPPFGTPLRGPLTHGAWTR